MRIEDKFKAFGVTIKRRLYTVRVAFDEADPAILSGDPAAVRMLPPSAHAVAEACTSSVLEPISTANNGRMTPVAADAGESESRKKARRAH